LGASFVIFLSGLYRLYKPSQKICNFSKEYLSLLAKFPEDKQGLTLDSTYFEGILDQPMTYGLVLSSETYRYRYCKNNESLRRIRKAVLWLLENSDLDKDGFPGWGLPYDWDAFGDGSVNKANQPYTITTAIVLMGLLDALSLEIWTNSEKESIRKLVIETALLWCKEFYAETEYGDFFWYSTNPQDAYFVPNVSAMFLGVLTRLLNEQHILKPPKIKFIKDKVDKAVKGIITYTKFRNNAPFFPYIVKSKEFAWQDSNDLVHHSLTLYGLELYRSCGGNIKLPYTREQAIQSLELFMKDGMVYNYPQDIIYTGDYEFCNTRPAILWGIGMMLAFYSKFGDIKRSEKIVNIISIQYGPYPNLKLWPKYFSKNENFYHRHAAYVLFGLALRDYHFLGK